LIAPVRIVDKESGEGINVKKWIQYSEDKDEYFVTFDKALGDKSYTIQYQSLEDIITVFDDLKFNVDVTK